MIYRAIKDLAQYGIAKGLIEKEDEVYVINSILQELQLDGLDRQLEQLEQQGWSLPEWMELLGWMELLEFQLVRKNRKLP
ncbi:MAG: hypothetical protein IJ969_01115, partial [Anaerotignum sp.]|nr:hypothetical protein [Anaerotignum sp.]